MEGGKACRLSEETKEKLSLSKKGRFKGAENPNFGKTHSKETREKISQSQKGKKMSEERKSKMRNLERAPQPRRKYSDLPQYIYHVINSKNEGYEIRHHPTLKNKSFVSSKLTMPEKLQKIKSYLESTIQRLDENGK
jgi:hypothetical protein